MLGGAVAWQHTQRRYLIVTLWWLRLVLMWRMVDPMSTIRAHNMRGMAMKSWDIVGYTFSADIYCTEHIVGALPTGEGQPFDGWKLAAGVRMDVEDDLSEIAYAFQIDRMDESSFDSGEFPKVIFASDATEDDVCAVCGESL